MPTLKDALDLIGKLTKTEQESLKMILLRPTPTRVLDIEEFLTDKKFSNGRICPHCGKSHIVRNGHRADGTQRYKCKDCNKTFVVASNSIVSGTHKNLDVWQKYIECMMNGTSIRKSATICGINRNTAFIWRHKILDALQNMANEVELDGILKHIFLCTFLCVDYC